MPKRYRAIADYYDAENARHAMLEHDVPFFLGQLPRRRQSVLELGTGTARAAIPIAQAGHRVVGVDYAGDMLAVARHKRDAVGIKERDLSLVRSDLLRLDLGRRFDWVCLFFNTFLAFTTLKEQDRLLQNVRRHLKPSGRFWLDILNPDPGLIARDFVSGVDPAAFYVPRHDRTVFISTDLRRTKQPQVQRVTFHYHWFDRNGHEQQRRVEFDMTFLFPRELQLLLERNGLQIERQFGNYDASRATPISPRLIVRCCRM